MAARGVLLLGEDSLALAGLERLLEAEAGWRVAGTILLPLESEALARQEADAGLWDLGSQSSSPSETLWFPDGLPGLALVADATTAREAMAAGARGALSRDASPERLRAGLDAIVQGLIVLDEEISEALLRPAPLALPSREALTARENEVLQLLALGLTNREIGARLGVSPHTAKFHVNSVLGKLGAASRTEALALAARLGLVTF